MWIAVVAGMAILAGAGLWVWRSFSGERAGTKNPRVSEVIQPGGGKPAFEIHGVLKIGYRDLGNAVEVGLQAKGNPALYVDVNQNGVAEEGVSYAASPDGSVCVQRVNLTQEGAHCGTVPSGASAKVTREEDWWKVVWKIPKKELQHGGDGVDFAVKVFDGATQRRDFYPAEPFSKVYHLQFASGEAMSRPSPPREEPRPAPAVVSPPEKAAPLPVEGKRSGGDAPVIARFDASPESVARGESASLRWSVTGASSVDLEPGAGAVAATGEKVVTPEQTTRYKLTAKGPGGAATSEVSVAVAESAAPQIASFQAEPETVQAGGTTRLQWTVAGKTTRVQINPGLEAVAAQGERLVPVTQTTEFTLTAVGPGGAATRKVTVRVASAAPPTVRFDADSMSIHQGESAMLRWSVTGQARVTIEPGLGVNANIGSLRVKPLNTTRYTLTADGPGGVATRDVTITVGRPLGPSSGVIVWTGEVRGTQLVTIDKDHADVGTLLGSLPGLPCIVQPASEKGVSIASAPGPRNNFERLILRVQGNGPTRVVIAWSLQ